MNPQNQSQNSSPARGLSLEGLEQSYDLLAEAIDRAGEAKSELLLVKLALLCARELGDAGAFDRLLKAAECHL